MCILCAHYVYMYISFIWCGKLGLGFLSSLNSCGNPDKVSHVNNMCLHMHPCDHNPVMDAMCVCLHSHTLPLIVCSKYLAPQSAQYSLETAAILLSCLPQQCIYMYIHVYTCTCMYFVWLPCKGKEGRHSTTLRAEYH